MPKSGLNIVFMGSPDFSCPSLSKLLSSDHKVTHVLTQPPRASGRGMQETKTAVAQLAESHNIPTSWPLSLKTKDSYDLLKNCHADLFVVVAYGLILPKDILDLPRLGALNGHASLLPRWRGAAPIQRAIEAGDDITGTCAMMMEEGLDTGPVILKSQTPISADDTASTLHDRLADMTADTLLEAIDALANGTAIAAPQSADGILYAHKIQKSDAALSFDKEAVEIKRQIHAFSPFPGGFITGASGKRTKCLTAYLPDTQHSQETGTYLGSDDKGLLIGCANGTTLGISMIQPAGKKPMSASEFLRGRHLEIGIAFDKQM